MFNTRRLSEQETWHLTHGQIGATDRKLVPNASFWERTLCLVSTLDPGCRYSTWSVHYCSFVLARTLLRSRWSSQKLHKKRCYCAQTNNSTGHGASELHRISLMQTRWNICLPPIACISPRRSVPSELWSLTAVTVEFRNSTWDVVLNLF